MRILAVTNMLPSPQAPALGIFVQQQIESLKQIGLRVEVLFADRQKGMRIYGQIAKEVRQRAVQTQPDIVHIMYGGVMAERVTRTVRKTPTVVTFHGSDLLGEHLSGFARKWASMYGVRCSIKAAQLADGVIVVSNQLKDKLTGLIEPSKIRVIPCGIDLERFKPHSRTDCRIKLGWDPDSYHVLFPSNNGNPVKRPEIAEATVLRLRESGLRIELHYLRGVPNSEVPEWLNASDALLLTSLHEGSPTVVKEALACNLPIVSVDVGDVQERIDGVAGCYLANPDPADLAAKLRLVFNGPGSVAGRFRVGELSLLKVAERLQRFYEQILGSRRGDSQVRRRQNLGCARLILVSSNVIGRPQARSTFKISSDFSKR